MAWFDSKTTDIIWWGKQSRDMDIHLGQTDKRTNGQTDNWTNIRTFKRNIYVNILNLYNKRFLTNCH